MIATTGRRGRNGLERCERLLDRPARPRLRAALVRLRDWYAEVLDVVERGDWRADELPELPADVVEAARPIRRKLDRVRPV